MRYELVNSTGSEKGLRRFRYLVAERMESATGLVSGLPLGEKRGGIAGVLLYLGKACAASFQVSLSESYGHVKRTGGGLEGGQIP